MARGFALATSKYLEVDSAPVTAAPFTISLWFRSLVDAEARSALVFIGDKDVANQFWHLGIEPSGTNNAEFILLAGGGPTFVSPSNLFTVNTWTHLCAIETSATSRRCILSGDWANSATNATNLAPANADRLSVCRDGDSSPGYHGTSEIAEIGIWNVALTEAENDILALGYSPAFVRPQNLVSHWELIRDEDIDKVGGLDLTAYNSPTIVSHPPIIYPAPPFLSFPVSAAPEYAMPMAMIHYKQRRI